MRADPNRRVEHRSRIRAPMFTNEARTAPTLAARRLPPSSRRRGGTAGPTHRRTPGPTCVSVRPNIVEGVGVRKAYPVTRDRLSSATHETVALPSVAPWITRGLCCTLGPPIRREELHAPIRRDQDPRLHPCPGRAVRGLPARRPRRRRHQGGRPERAGPEPGVGSGPRAEQGADGHGLPHPGIEQARDRAEPQDGGRARSAQAPGRRVGRRAGGELPARRVQGAGPGLRGSRPDQAHADLRLDDRLRPGGARVATQTAYDHAIQATSGITASTGTEASGPIKVGRADGRLRDGDDGRLRHLGGPLPAPAHRPGAVHRHGDARRGDDPAGLAHHGLPALRPPPEAGGQRHALRRLVGLPDQGRPRAARRQQRAPAPPLLRGHRRSRGSEALEPRGALRAARRKSSPRWPRR